MVYRLRHPRLYPRGQYYYFRMVVPKSLRHVLRRREVTKSTSPLSYGQACDVALRYTRFLEKYFRIIQCMRPDNETIKALIRNHFEKCLMDAEDTIWTIRESTRDGTAKESIEEIIADMRRYVGELQKIAQINDYGPRQAQDARKLLKWKGYSTSENSEEFHQLASGVMDAQLEAARLQLIAQEKSGLPLRSSHHLLEECRNYLTEPDFDLYRRSQHEPYHLGEQPVISLTAAIDAYLEGKVQESPEWRKNHRRYLTALKAILRDDW